MSVASNAPVHGFPVAEFEHRASRAQEIMATHGFDALVVTTPPNFRYFSGFDSQFWESPTRPWFIVIPAQGEPVGVVPSIGATELSNTWIKKVHSWPAPVPEDDGVSLLAGVLSELQRRHGRIGMELGREHSLRMPVMDFYALQDKLSGIEIANGSPCLWEIRMVKTDGEVARIRHICEIVSDAYASVPDLVSIGDTEREACHKLRIDILQRGADAVPFLPGVSAPGGLSQIVCGPTDRVVQDGDVLFFDNGSTYDGYFSDFDRNYAVGQIPDETRRTQDAVWRATEAGIKAAVVGATTDNVHAAMAKILEDAGSRGNNVGRMGHGLGLQLTEPPSNMPGDGTVIKAGMVLTIEPGMAYEPGKMIVHEENLVVTPDGPQLLTKRAPREMLQIS
jgi:Xaa-Pro dipeptidase